jgi:predicted nucleic acid-binding protein
MSVEFVDTNVLLYAHDRSAGAKYTAAAELLSHLAESMCGTLSFQVLAEFYAAGTRKMGMDSEEAEAIIRDFGGWIIHRPEHADLLRAARLQRRYQISWWDALVLNSAVESGCSILWTEDLQSGRNYAGVQVRNPFL